MAPRKCGSCDKCFNKNDGTVSCDGCKRRYHEKCTPLSDAERGILFGSNSLKWFCILCKDDVDNILSNYEKFLKVSDAIEKIKNENESRFAEIEKRLDRCEAGTNEPEFQKKIVEEVKKSNEKDMEEIALVKSKENNLIYFGLPEKDDESTAERMKHDFKLLSEAYSQEIDNKEILSMFRVGKKVEGNNRPLVIKYASLQIKNKFLKSSGNLKIKTNNEIKPIYISIDRTQNQRAKHRQLVNEMKKRREDGEENLVIRGEKIVQNFQKEEGAKKITWASLFQG